jgi:Tfp pilus assembly protein PilE
MGPWRYIAKRLASEEGGFTLVELLVVIIIAIVTTLALFAFQDLALRQSSRVFAKVDATQEARQAIERIETRLHSACVAEDVTPIQAGSTPTSLRFISKFTSAATVTPEKHTIALSGTSLNDSTYAVTGGSSPNWTFASTPSSTVRLLSNVTWAPGSSNIIFRYYKYGPAQDSSGNAYVDAAGNPFYILLDGTSTLPSGLKTSGGASVPAGTLPANSAPIASASQPGGLTTQDAQDTAAIGITFKVGADGSLGTNTVAASPITVSDTVVLRITPVPSDNNQGVPSPCE